MIDVSFSPDIASNYTSKSQIARILTESWTESHMYCPICGWSKIKKFPNNKSVADFYCENCKSEFEQKSKNGVFGSKIADGSYNTFIERIGSNNNPDFFMMNYSIDQMQVKNLYFVPKYFFVPEIVEKRKPLSGNAIRAGWTGCNILFDKIPVQGRIPIIEGSVAVDKNIVLNRVKMIQRLRTDNILARGWLLDVLNCVNAIQCDFFTLDMIYDFEQRLSRKYPNNNNIRAKIRQQLQQLRDRGIIAFLGNGQYEKMI